MTLAALITSVRTLAKDTDTANYIQAECPTEPVDGSNTHFRLQHRNIVGTNSSTHSVYVSYTGTWRTQTGFTVDLDNGLITFSPAPANNLEIKVDYNFHWFTDTEHTEFLNDAANLLGQTDPTLVPAGLQMALKQYALGYYWQARASKYADKYSSSSVGVTAQVDVVTKNFSMLSKAAFDRGDSFRDDFYKRQGSREAPVSGTVTYGFDPYTPPR